MTRAGGSISIPARDDAPSAQPFNSTVEPYGAFGEPGFPGMPEEIRDAIAVLRRARNEAANEIERLLGFLNETEMDYEENEIDAVFRARFGDQPFEEEIEEREPEPEHDELTGDEEPSLGSSHSMQQATGARLESVTISRTSTTAASRTSMLSLRWAGTTPTACMRPAEVRVWMTQSRPSAAPAKQTSAAGRLVRATT